MKALCVFASYSRLTPHTSHLLCENRHCKQFIEALDFITLVFKIDIQELAKKVGVDIKTARKLVNDIKK
jgi:hypothetical protein